MRVISLLASATEIICALGFEKDLVGRSHECDYPESVHGLPVCSEPKFQIEGSSNKIHERVEDLVWESLSVYHVNVNRLKELKPDVIVTQDHCEVCAVSLKEVESATSELIESKPRIVTLKPETLDDVWSGVHQVAEVLGNSEKGVSLIKAYKNRIQEISEKANRFNFKHKPSIVCIEWLDPLMSAANWMPQFITMLGGKNIFGQHGSRALLLSWNDLKNADPDIILIMPCGFSIKKTLQNLGMLTKRLGWNDLKAVREKQVAITDGNQYFNRPGPRLVDSFEILAEIMYPNNFHFNYEGHAWRWL